jgi:hypothetical protein
LELLPMSMRYKLPPGGDCPPIAAARVMWLTIEAFQEKLPALLERKFPPPDPTTGNFDMDAINAWRRSRYPHLFREDLTPAPTARNADDVVRSRLAGARSG